MDTKVEVNKSKLGHYRAEIERLTAKSESDIKKLGFDSKEKAITQKLAMCALDAGVTVDELKAQMETLGSKSTGGNLDVLRREHISTITNQALQYIGFGNMLMVVNPDNLTSDQCKSILKSGKEIITKLTEHLQKSDITRNRGKQGFQIAIHAPVYNFLTQKPTNDHKLALMQGGWSDKSRDYDQYGVRMEAGGSATFYRPVSYDTPVMDIPKAKETPKAKNKNKSPETPKQEKPPETPETPKTDK